MTLRGAIACIIAWVCVQPAPGKWLVIAAENRTITNAIRSKEKLAASWPGVTIVSSGDCEGVWAGWYFTVVLATGDPGSARQVAAKLRAQAREADVRECRPRPHTRLALGVPVVDPSIEKVPADAVNWRDEDRISKVVRLPVRGYLWFRRWYKPNPEDPRQGRRVAVLFFTENPQRAVSLELDCTDPSYAQRGEWIALSCARETAGDHLFHETKVYNSSTGQSVVTERRCRTPHFLSSTEVMCQAEEVDAEGRLRLVEARRVRFR